MDGFRPSLLVTVLAAVGFFYLIVPVLIVIPLSLSESRFLEFPPSGYSLQWYRAFFADSGWMLSLRRSLEIGFLTAVLAACIGTPAAVALVRGRIAFRRGIIAAILSPMIIPVIITAIALFGVLSSTGIGGYWSIVIGHVVLALPFVVISVATSLVGFDDVYERASMSLGASPGQTFLRVTLPNIAPGVITGMLLAFVTSFDDVVVAMFVGGSTMTLSRKIWDDLVVLVEPTQAAASTILMVISTALLALSGLVQRWLGPSATRDG
jgi:putative spermidine/putrescine transport system permease protein